MSEFPQPDLLDSRGRLRRLVISLFIGGAAAAVAYLIASSAATPETAVGTQQTSAAYKFVFYMTALAGATAFTIALVIQNKLADKKYRNGLVAKAQLRKS